MTTPDSITMSSQELDRLGVIERVLDRQLTQVKASKQKRTEPGLFNDY